MYTIYEVVATPRSTIRLLFPQLVTQRPEVEYVRPLTVHLIRKKSIFNFHKK